MNKSHIFGYLLGLLIFVIGIPVLMWLVSGRPWPYAPDSAILCIVSLFLAICGLALSIYSIVYMRIVGKGNPFDAYGHELAPRTKHLMTSGPYRMCRNPMLVGIYIYDAGVLVWLWSVIPLLIVLAEVILLTLQVRSEEKRLAQDFGQEYLDYKKRVGRYFPWSLHNYENMPKIKTHKVSKFMVYDRMARKGSPAYSPKSHSAPHFEGHYVEGMEEWASHYCFNLKEDGTYEAELDEAWDEGSHYGGGTISVTIPKDWFDLSYDEFLERVITLAAAKHYGFTSDDLKEKKGLKEFFGF